MKLAKHDDSVNVGGTSYRGNLTARYFDLVHCFGEPNLEESGDGKVRAEWDLEFEDEDGNLIVATIYDWKESKPIEEVTDWHIGGHGFKSTFMVQDQYQACQGATGTLPA